MSAMTDQQIAASLFDELHRLREDVLAGFRIANELTLETQTVEEMAADLVRQVREARAELEKEREARTKRLHVAIAAAQDDADPVDVVAAQRMVSREEAIVLMRAALAAPAASTDVVQEAEHLHAWLDKGNVPRRNKSGLLLSLVGRVIELHLTTQEKAQQPAAASGAGPTLIERLLSASTGDTEWQIVNPENDGIRISFEHESSARRYMEANPVLVAGCKLRSAVVQNETQLLMAEAATALAAAQAAPQPAPDTARLDWLEAWHDCEPKAESDKGLPGYGDPGMALITRTSDGWLIDGELPGAGGTEHDTLRDAIDAAMQDSGAAAAADTTGEQQS